MLAEKKETWSWGMESKPPAACLGRKDNRSVFPWSFASIFIDQVAGERFVSHSERIYISYKDKDNGKQ